MTKDSVALELYRQGRTNLTTRTIPSITEAFERFSRVVERDSTFALGWSGLARAAQLAWLLGAPIPGQPPDSLIAIALAASQRGVTLDSSASEVWVVRARVLEAVEPSSRTSALSDLRRALAADSLNSDAWFALARMRDEMLDSTGARVAYDHAVRLAPRNIELLAFFALHYHYANTPRSGMRWADSALAIDPMYQLARSAAVLLALEARDLRLAEQHLLALQRVARGRERVLPLTHGARLAALKGDDAGARRFAQEAAQLVDSATLTKHESVFLASAFAAAGDTATAYRWLAAYTPRSDIHFQLHLKTDWELAWVRDERYRHLLSR